MKYRTRIYYSEEQKALMWDRWQKGEVASFLREQSTPKNTDYCSKQKTISTIRTKVGFELPTLSTNTSIVVNLGCESRKANLRRSAFPEHSKDLFRIWVASGD